MIGFFFLLTKHITIMYVCVCISVVVVAQKQIEKVSSLFLEFGRGSEKGGGYTLYPISLHSLISCFLSFPRHFELYG